MIKHAGIYDPATHTFIYAHVIYEHVIYEHVIHEHVIYAHAIYEHVMKGKKNIYDRF